MAATSGSFWDVVESQTAAAALSNKFGTEHGSKEIAFRAIKFINICAIKLEMKILTKATACSLFHRFFRSADFHNYDEYLVAMTSMFLAGKIEEDHMKLRDVINVSYRTLHFDMAPLRLDSTYYQIMDSLLNFELFLCRMLKFQLTTQHPHMYLLHYLKSLRNWVGQNSVPFPRLAWSLLNDSYFSDMCLRYKPEHVAVAACYLALSSYGVVVPLSDEAQVAWWNVFVDDLSMQTLEYVCSEIFDIYSMETIAFPVDGDNIR